MPAAVDAVKQTERLVDQRRRRRIKQQIDLGAEARDQVRRGSKHEASGRRRQSRAVADKEHALADKFSDHVGPRFPREFTREP